MQPGPASHGARAERTIAGDQVQAVEVDVPEIELPTYAMIEQGQLVAQVAQRLLDLGGEAPPTPRGDRVA